VKLLPDSYISSPAIAAKTPTPTSRFAVSGWEISPKRASPASGTPGRCSVTIELKGGV
jgi:hypothetical protein